MLSARSVIGLEAQGVMVETIEEADLPGVAAIEAGEGVIVDMIIGVVGIEAVVAIAVNVMEKTVSKVKGEERHVLKVTSYQVIGPSTYS